MRCKIHNIKPSSSHSPVYRMPQRAAPPPPKKPNSIVKVVKALYKYTATRDDEVSFVEGDTLYILSEPEVGWFLARVGHPEQGSSGLVPANYVEESTETVENPLHEAAKRGNVGFLRECLANSVSVNGLDNAGCTPLHWAAAGGYEECLRLLLSQNNVLINVQNKLGDTPLHQAAWKCKPESVSVLLEADAKTDIRNKEGKTPHDLSRDPQSGAMLRDLRRSSNAAASEYIDNDAAEDSD